MKLEKIINLIFISFFIFFIMFSILALFKIVEFNLIKIINTMLLVIFILSVAIISDKEEIDNVLNYLIGLFSFVYFTEILFLPNLFDYLLIITIFLLVFTFIKNKINLNYIYQNYIKNDFTIKILILFLFLWFLYSVSSLLWAKDKQIIIHRLQFIIYSVFIFILYFYSYISKKFKIIVNTLFFLSIFLIILIISEMKFGIHYPGTHPVKSKVFKTFGGTSWNINDFATFLYISLYFIQIFLVSNSNNKLNKIYFLFPFLTTIIYLFIYFIKRTYSRANFLGICIFVALFFLFLIIFYLRKLFLKLKKLKHKILFFTFLFLLLVTFSIVTFNFINLKNGIIENEVDKIKKSIQKSIDPSTPPKYLNSDILRIRLALNSLIMLKDSHFMGVGPGNSIILMKEYSEKYYSTTRYTKSTVTNVHNFWLELLIEYGPFIFMIFIIFYISLAIKSIRLTFVKSVDSKEILLSILSFSSLAGFIIASISVSSLLTRPVVWIYLFYIFFIITTINFTQKEKNEKVN